MDAWDKQESETNRAYNAFLTYRNMGSLRSLSKAAAIFYGTESTSNAHTFRRWSAKHNWVARCGDFDIEQDRIFQVEQQEAIMEMNKRQANIGVAMQKKGITRLLEIDIETSDQARLCIKDGVIIERPARGEATEISEHKGELGIKIIEVDDEIAKKALDEIAKRKIRNTGTTSTED